MYERVLHGKTTEAKEGNTASRAQNIKHSALIYTPINRILSLQRSIGNHAVDRMIRSGILQAKLKIGQPGDIYEQEADRVADAVMRMTEPQKASIDDIRIQRACPECAEEELHRQTIKEEEDEEKLQMQPVKEEEDEEKLQAKGSSDIVCPENVESQILSLKGRGNPLSEGERGFFEPRFGADLSQVRLHSDSHAADLAQGINARAFTFGHDIVFGRGEYAPETGEGKRLIGHELTHVVQQTNWRNGKDQIVDHKETLHHNPVQINHGSLAFDIRKEGAQPSTRFIMAIFVDLTSQTVSWIYSDGMVSETFECSTGAGLCNSDCNSPNRGGSACTPVGGPFPVCRRRPHSSYQYWVEFDCNRQIAFHYYPDVDGCPWSHGCVRMHSDAIRLIYEGSVKDRTLVYVNGTPNLRRCWTSSTAGRCWVRGTGRTRRCKRNDCLEMGDFPIPDTSETATRIE